MVKTIGIVVGSLRKASFSKKIAQVIVKMAPNGFTFKLITLEDIPIYNQDFDDQDEVPPAYVIFRKTIKELDGVIFVTPEYNRSMPAVLKNALDVGSRPYGKSVWATKPAAVFSNAPGNLSAFGANHHLRQSLVFLDMYTMQQPEVYLANVHTYFDEDGNLKEAGTLKFLQSAVDAYIAWFNKFN